MSGEQMKSLPNGSHLLLGHLALWTPCFSLQALKKGLKPQLPYFRFARAEAEVPLLIVVVLYLSRSEAPTSAQASVTDKQR